MKAVIFLLLLLALFPVPHAGAQDGTSVLVLSCEGKGYSDGATIEAVAGREITLKVKVFIKEYKVSGGTWKKNIKGEWRFHKEYKGYGLGVGVGNMSLNILKEEYTWKIMGQPCKTIAKSQEIKWKVPGNPGETSEIQVITRTEGQVKTEGSASFHGVHLDYNLPGGGKKVFAGKARITVKAVEKKPQEKKKAGPKDATKDHPESPKEDRKSTNLDYS